MAFLRNSPRSAVSKRTGYTYKGQEIVLTKTAGPPKRGLVAKGILKGMFPDEKKIEAATIYAVTGSLQRTFELTKVPLKVLQQWRAQDDFKALLREVWEENNEKIDSQFTAIIEKSLNAIVDRLDHGDFKMSPRGTVERVPISAKDLSVIQAIQVDKRQLLRGLPTSRSDSGASASEKTVHRLEQLAETFENLARLGRKPRVLDITEAEVIQIEDKSAEGEGLGPNGAGVVISASEGYPENQIQGREEPLERSEECRAAEITSETTPKSA